MIFFVIFDAFLGCFPRPNANRKYIVFTGVSATTTWSHIGGVGLLKQAVFGYKWVFMIETLEFFV